VGHDRGVLAQRLKWDVAEIVKKQAEVGIDIICRSCSMTTMAGAGATTGPPVHAWRRQAGNPTGDQ